MIQKIFLWWLCFAVVVYARLPPQSDPRVEILGSIVGQFGYPVEFAKSWKGIKDPCDWYGVTCLEGVITGISFISMNLTGTISPRFAELKSLRVIDLSHNHLTGTIPFELTKLDLITLDVSFNQLHGKVPHFRSIVPDTEGNPDIETNRVLVPLPTRNKYKSAFEVLLAIFVGLFVAGGVALGFYLFRKMKKSHRLPEPDETVVRTQQSGDEIVEAEGCFVIPLQRLREATEDFSESNFIGKGAFGSVYKGKLQNGDVAVKRMKQEMGGEGLQQQFKSEVEILTKVHHRNLVVLQGYCLEGNERLLVYEYMPQGTLARHLFQWKDQGLTPLDWPRRLTIALDVARGLEYLHNLARQSQSYIHRDLKPANILLGDDMRAKVTDFGLARVTAEGREPITTTCVGSLGYMAPEYEETGQLTTKADVYSYGVILMELLTGQKAIDGSRIEDDHISDWFRKACDNEDTFAKAIDETVELNEENRSIIEEVAKLANHCCAKKVTRRPEMSDIVSVLTSLTGKWNPSDSEEERDIDDTTISEIQLVCLARVHGFTISRQQYDGYEHAESWGNENVYDDDGPFDNGDYQSDAEDTNSLISQPRQVNKIEVQYDKALKQVDVQVLKETLWECLQESSQPPIQDEEHQYGSPESRSFKELLASFPDDCQAAGTTQDISPLLFFICLLHLANEHNLGLLGSQELDDLTIHLAWKKSEEEPRREANCLTSSLSSSLRLISMSVVQCIDMIL